MKDLRRRLTGINLPQDKLGRVASGVSLAILLLHWALIVQFVVVRAGSLSFLRLHYSAAFGVDWVDRWWFIFTFPVLGLATFVMNLWLADRLAWTRPALGTMVRIATIILQLLFATGGALAILLNS